MIITLKQGTTERDIRRVMCAVEKKKGLEARVTKGKNHTVVEVIGDTAGVSTRTFESYVCVQQVDRISAEYKRVAKVGGKDNTLVRVNGIEIGGESLVLMMGPCSVESPEQIMEAARIVSELPKGNHIAGYLLRGGAFKPRSSPYSFQGHGLQAVKWMKQAGEEYGLPIVTEVMDSRDIESMLDAGVDVFQVGARNSQNYSLLKELGRQKRPVLLKRGIAGTIDEILLSAEYIVRGGNDDVILCLRGIRSYNTGHYRNQVDVPDIMRLQELTHLPVIYDPSHATGKRDVVIGCALQAIIGAADGLIVEMHPNPEEAWSDGAQSLFPRQAHSLAKAADEMKQAFNSTREYRITSEQARE